MNDIRKQIIELIEPYMDKTLSGGCIVMNIKIQEIQKVLYFSNNFWYVSGSIHGHQKEMFEGNRYKILGHYDITGVLKYISIYAVAFVNMENITIHSKGFTEDYGNIPNKPLHLYTEQEDKDLLELLLKLK